ncbi:[NiFe] hydrogenase nickel incorporation-associated protein HypB [Caenispirillum salinarum AK4]|uniref:Hydrogenase maturation factor HypB n=1 Tax=Caenispirillum salinarum AK4 TaxID=1238182 RepID=K9GZM8_9PROT|nr:hydrogenase nickel incorporation protein HypB [Caenispirillum salinarum]EKV30747.1 [NiFe] hydrogenase nickel incorporation-associated protein HypB [Caenispirillum salinarum AK4]
MCTVCGCGQASVEGRDSTPAHHHHDHHDHDAAHADMHARGIPHSHDDGHIHYGAGVAGVSVPGLDQARIVKIEQDVLGHNDRLAAVNRARFAAEGIIALNLVSSPGSGKTTLLCETINMLSGRVPVAVVEGDQQTSFDADRIRETGAPAIQVNTGKGCHLDAAMVADATDRLQPGEGSVLFIENVGNLVCPAGFDLGEAAKVVILSVTEGEDKPLKYPDMFAAADLMILNKIDLLPHVRFDVDRCLELAHRVKPDLPVLQLSATTGQGMHKWLGWIDDRRDALLAARAAR